MSDLQGSLCWIGILLGLTRHCACRVSRRRMCNGFDSFSALTRVRAVLQNPRVETSLRFSHCD